MREGVCREGVCREGVCRTMHLGDHVDKTGKPVAVSMTAVEQDLAHCWEVKQ